MLRDIDVPMRKQKNKKKAKKARLRRPFEHSGPLVQEIKASKMKYPQSSRIHKLLEAMRLAIDSKTKVADMTKFTGWSRASIYRYARILSEGGGIAELCTVSRIGYRASTTKITPDIGATLKSEIKRKRLRRSQDIIMWLECGFGIEMKANGIYAWLRRNGLKLRPNYPDTRAQKASANQGKMNFHPRLGWVPQ
jgi:hypothetical protein